MAWPPNSSGGPAGAEGHGAAGGGRGGAVDVGGAEVHVDAIDELGIEHLVGEQGVVAGVVERNAIEGHRDARAVEAADAQVAARGAVAIVVGEVHARELVDGLEQRLPAVCLSRYSPLSEMRDFGAVWSPTMPICRTRVAVTTTSLMSSSMASVPVDCAKAFCDRPAPKKHGDWPVGTCGSGATSLR